MPTRVLLMRHAQTAAPDVFHGFESDVDLSELGYRQADAVAPVVAAWRPDVLICSAMRRARLTAEPIARACRIPPQTEPDLHERKVGALVGQPAQPELGIWPDTLQRWIDGDTGYAPEGSESFDQIRDRVLPVWQRLMQTHHGQKIAIVCHGIVCRVLTITLIPSLTLADWKRLGRIHNMSMSEFVEDGSSWRAERLYEVPPAVCALATTR